MVFVDVRGFTALSEKTDPTVMVARLNRFYNLAARTVSELDGTLDKMVGDEVMAFFGAPFRHEDHAARAVQAALKIVSGAMSGSDSSGSDGQEGLPVGGGVATGEVFMGEPWRGVGPRLYRDWRHREYRGQVAGFGSPGGSAGHQQDI